MATLASLLINIGVKVDGALKSEQVVKKLQGTTKAMGRDAKHATAEAQTGFRRLGSSIANMARRARASLSSLIQRMGGLKTIALASVAAIGAAGAGLFKFVDSQTASLDATNKLSAALGIGIEELQRLQFAAGQSGLSHESLGLAMRTLNKQMLDVQQGGGKKLQEALERVGLAAHDLDGLSRTQQIGLIGDALNKVTDDAERSALAAEIFGSRAGPEMATLLREGTAGIAALTEGAKGVFSQEDADRATAFQDRLGEVKNELGAVSNIILIELLPYVEEAILGFQGWVRQNDEFIQQDLPKFLAAIGGALATVAKFLANVIKAVSALSDAWNRLVEALGPAGVALEVIADIIFTLIAPVLKGVEAINNLGDAFTNAGHAALQFGDNVREGVQKAMAEVRAAAARDAREAQAAWRAANPDFVPSGPAPGSGGPAVPSKPAARRGGGGGGGGRAKKESAPAAKKEAKDKPVSALTLSQALSALQRGHLETMNQNIRDMGTSTPSTKSIQPTVAMDVTINTNNFQIEQNIESTDPVAAGRESVAEFKRAWHETLQRTGLSIPGMTVR